MTEVSALQRCLDDPGHTPPRAALPTLVACLGELDADRAARLERCLASAGWPAAEAARAALSEASEAQRVRLYSLLGRFATAEPHPDLYAVLVTGLADASERCRRVAASALGKLGDARAEAELLALLDPGRLELARVVVEALGKVGGANAVRALEALSTNDAELDRRLKRARLLLSRRQRRDETSRLVFEQRLPARERIVFECRRGLADLLADELSALSPRKLSSTLVEIEHDGSIDELLVARTALRFGLWVPLDPRAATSAAARIAEALARPQTLAALRAWTVGPIRLRLDFREAGHQRALAWSIAEELAERAPALINDPRSPTFTVLAHADGTGELLLVPRVEPDPRFAFRKRDVPAASHPTIAAALARIAGASPNDVVWDPFVGSGLELIERARLGPYTRLIGSDVDPRALSAARENVDSAGVGKVELVRGDALSFAPPGVNLIVTNPPMGRRVARDGSLGELLEQFVQHAARVLPRRGRMVWLSVLDRRTEQAARRAGFDVAQGPELDLGGFSARVQVFSRR
jgi:predicted RNA methylase